MNKRSFVEFVVAWILIIIAIVITILPLFGIRNIKNIFLLTISSYGIIHLFKNIFILQAKEYSGFSTAGASAFILIIMLFLDLNESPWNLALLLFIWIILMSLIKLKESDYYHDRKNKIWLLNIVNLVLFIVSGILAAISLNYTADIQILVIGFFFLINGILELMDPLATYILEKKEIE